MVGEGSPAQEGRRHPGVRVSFLMCVYMLTDTHGPSGFRSLQGQPTPVSTQDAFCLQGSAEVHSPIRPGLDTGLLLWVLTVPIHSAWTG